MIEKLDWEKMDGLIPTIVTDSDNQVLMLAYSSKESLQKAIETKQGWYYSRSRQKLCQKGGTSGNTQKIMDISLDCDGDALLFKVKQKGPACHTGRYSCFNDKEFSIENLWQVLRERKENPDENSYSSSLFTHRKGAINKISEKLGEEAVELILSFKDDNKEELVKEAADLLYFVTMMFAEKNININKVLDELDKRSR